MVVARKFIGGRRDSLLTPAPRIVGGPLRELPIERACANSLSAMVGLMSSAAMRMLASEAAVPDVSSQPGAKLGQATRITPRNSRVQKVSCPVGATTVATTLRSSRLILRLRRRDSHVAKARGFYCHPRSEEFVARSFYWIS
jgi:hypothetical protein